MDAAIGALLRRKALGITVIVSALFGAAAVHGQSIDQYLEPSIAGTGIEPGVTVVSRVRPEYEMRGFHLGNFTVKPELAETAGYDSNVTGTTPGRGSPLVETNGTLQAVSNWSRNSIGLNVGVDDFRYTAQPRQSYTNFSASLGGSYDIGRDTLSLSATHLNLNETPRDLDVPQLDRVVPYRVNDFRLTYRAPFSRITLLPTLDVASYNYDNGTIGGLPYIQSFRDRVVIQPSLETRYEMDPLRSLVLIVRDAKANYSNRPPGAPTLDFNDVSVLGGVNFDTGGLVRLRLLAGYETRTYSSQQFRTISAPIVEASAIYTPTGLTTVTLNAARYIQDSASDTTVGYTETALRLRVDHEYLQNVLLDAQAGLYSDQYQQQNQGHQSLYSLGVGATWLMSRRMRLALTYDYTSRRGNSGSTSVTTLGQTQIFGGTYSENRILLQLRIGL